MAREKIRILEIVTSFQVGGTERQFVLLTRNLDRSRFEVSVACIRRSGQYLDGLESEGIPVTEHGFTSLAGMSVLRQQARLAALLRRERIDIVHSYGYYPNVFALPAAWLARVPVIVASIRDTGEWITPAQHRVQKIVSRLADRIFVNARAVVDTLSTAGYDGGRMTVIENGVDLSRFEGTHRPADRGAIRGELGVPAGSRLVVILSRMHRNAAGVDLKGLKYFLEAASILARRRDDVRFLVVGDGPQRAETEERARRLGLDGRVVFTGFRMDIPDILAETAVAVSSSLAEAISNSIVEAMAAGVPVVATRVGGTPEAVLDGETGLLVRPRDSSALASAIGRLLDDGELAGRLGRAGRKRIEERFSTERMVRATESVYLELIEEARRRSRIRSPWRTVRRPPAVPTHGGSLP
jgi:glycosyltransferase involved in cell wall biosynthesis